MTRRVRQGRGNELEATAACWPRALDGRYYRKKGVSCRLSSNMLDSLSFLNNYLPVTIGIALVVAVAITGLVDKFQKVRAATDVLEAVSRPTVRCFLRT